MQVIKAHKANSALLNACLLSCLIAPCVANAGDTILWRGWMDFGSCNRVKYYKDDFGITWPTNESVGQELHGEIYMARTLDEVAKNRVTSCALQGVATASVAALLTSGTGWPVFKEVFYQCLRSEGLTNFLADNSNGS
jgi:hypothetical protein